MGGPPPSPSPVPSPSSDPARARIAPEWMTYAPPPAVPHSRRSCAGPGLNSRDVMRARSPSYQGNARSTGGRSPSSSDGSADCDRRRRWCLVPPSEECAAAWNSRTGGGSSKRVDAADVQVAATNSRRDARGSSRGSPSATPPRCPERNEVGEVTSRSPRGGVAAPRESRRTGAVLLLGCCTARAFSRAKRGDVQGVGERTGDARGRRHRATTRRRRGCPLPHARIQRKSLRERRNERRRTYRPVEVNSLGGSGTQEVGRATAVGRERRPPLWRVNCVRILLGGVRSEAAASARRVLVKIEPRGRAGADVWVSDPRSRPNHKAASCVTLTRKVHSAERVAPHARSRPRARDGHHGAHRAREFQRPSPLPRGLLLSDPLTRASPPARLPSVIFLPFVRRRARRRRALSATRTPPDGPISPFLLALTVHDRLIGRIRARQHGA